MNISWRESSVNISWRESSVLSDKHGINSVNIEICVTSIYFSEIN